MISFADRVAVYLALEPVDMRKAMDGLSVLVEDTLGLDALSGQLFVFGNRRRDKIKILVWERNGFWVLYKRLEKARFKWPEPTEEGVVQISERELRWLLEGLDYARLECAGIDGSLFRPFDGTQVAILQWVSGRLRTCRSSLRSCPMTRRCSRRKWPL